MGFAYVYLLTRGTPVQHTCVEYRPSRIDESSVREMTMCTTVMRLHRVRMLSRVYVSL